MDNTMLEEARKAVADAQAKLDQASEADKPAAQKELDEAKAKLAELEAKQ